ncbi:MAG TPA: response regulator transcription factor [Candidatus Lumbricidophila sp.]|nr:response regulator transcription factor [Candidatus Lumbricidophila sp.]
MLILVVEDDPGTAELLVRGLAWYGYGTQWVRTAEAARAASGAADLVLLDLGLPDGDGLDLVRQLRTAHAVPIIVISGRASETDRVVGLELGADDYVVKPFGIREVIARVRALGRRATTDRDQATDSRIGDRLRIDRRAARVWVDGREIGLAPREYALLCFLAAEPGALLSREQIMAEVWDANWFGSTKTLDAHVSLLRRKLGGAIRIESVRGVGFRLETGSEIST